MEIIIVQLLLSLFGFGLSVSNHIDAHKPAAINGGVPCNYELNDVPNNITLQIDGYEIAYPIKADIESPGASGQNPTINSNPPHSPFAKGEEGVPRHYILAEPIMFRRAGDSEWKSFYTTKAVDSVQLTATSDCQPPTANCQPKEGDDR